MIIHFDRKLELCQQQNVAELIYFVCLTVNATGGSTPFVIEVLLNKRFYRTKLIFRFQAFKKRMRFSMSRNNSIRCGNRAWPIFGHKSFPIIIYWFLRRKRQNNSYPLCTAHVSWVTYIHSCISKLLADEWIKVLDYCIDSWHPLHSLHFTKSCILDAAPEIYVSANSKSKHLVARDV